MFTPVIDYINRQSSISLSSLDMELIKKSFIPRRYKKKEFLLREGEICQHIAFIVSGATRQFSVDEKGREQVLNLAIENWWVADRESFHKRTPSIYSIEAWENTDALLLPWANGCYEVINAIPAFCAMRRKLDDNHHMLMQRRLHNSIVSNAALRYNELLNTYPLFFERFPLHVIASYLGITKETLSRIRKSLPDSGNIKNS